MLFRSCHPCFALAAAVGLLLVLSAAAGAGSPQKRGSESDAAGEPESGPEFTIKVPVNVVPVKVTVTDKSGQFVTDLVAADFKLFEDGKRRRIQSFEIESGQPSVSSEAADPAGAAAAETPALQPLQGSVGEPGRLISLYIDDLTERSPEFFGWAVSALKEFVAEEMGPKDRVGVFSASRGVTIPFSGNREFLRGKVQALNVGKLDLARPYRGGGVKQPDEVRLTDLQAIRIVEGGHAGGVSAKIRAEAYRQYEETQAAVHRLLAGLALHLRYLRHFRASKGLVLLSEGFVLGKRTRWRLDQVIDRALRSRVLLHVVDIRGLYTVGFGASSDEPPVVPEFVAGRSVGRTLSALYLDQVYQSHPLEKVTEETGGTYFRDSNDLAAGLKQTANARSHYYVLSYASPDQKASGKFHRIRVEVSRPGLELSYRRGYYAPREKPSPEDRKNDDIRIALAAPDDFDQIPLELSHESSNAEKNCCRVSFFTHIKIYGMPFHRQRERRRNVVHLVVTVYDENGEQVEVGEQAVHLNLSESSYRSMLQRGFIARTEVEIPAGQYTVKAVVRESNQARMGSLQRSVRISVPGEGAENSDPAAQSRARPVPQAGLESGPLVLSQQLTPLADLSADQQQGLLASGDPLIFRDVRIHPVAADPIDRRQPVTFYYRLHNLRHRRQSREMTARVQLTDESGRVSRFPLISLGEGMTQSWGKGKVTVVFNLSFKSVQPGKYRLTVMTRAPAAGGQSVIARSAMTVAE